MMKAAARYDDFAIHMLTKR